MPWIYSTGVYFTLIYLFIYFGQKIVVVIFQKNKLLRLQ